MKNRGPYSIKTTVFRPYCLDKLEIVSCQFLAANHWSAKALELSSIVKVYGHKSPIFKHPYRKHATVYIVNNRKKAAECLKLQI